MYFLLMIVSHCFESFLCVQVRQIIVINVFVHMYTHMRHTQTYVYIFTYRQIERQTDVSNIMKIILLLVRCCLRNYGIVEVGNQLFCA